MGILFDGGKRYITDDGGNIEGKKETIETKIPFVPMETTEGTIAPSIENSLVCEKCGKICKSVAGLAVHLRSHKEE